MGGKPAIGRTGSEFRPGNRGGDLLVCQLPSLSLSLCFSFVVFPNLDHTLVMAIHAIYTLAGFGKDQLVNAVFADFAFETVGMIGIIAGHDSFVEDRFTTYAAAVGTVGAYRRPVG